ncbi:hypothetical protein LguiA_017815 [Lonicera macranthoides]
MLMMDGGWRVEADVVLMMDGSEGDRDSGGRVIVVPDSDEVKSIVEDGGDCEEVEVGMVGSKCEETSSLEAVDLQVSFLWTYRSPQPEFRAEIYGQIKISALGSTLHADWSRVLANQSSI